MQRGKYTWQCGLGQLECVSSHDVEGYHDVCFLPVHLANVNSTVFGPCTATPSNYSLWIRLPRYMDCIKSKCSLVCSCPSHWIRLWCCPLLYSAWASILSVASNCQCPKLDAAFVLLEKNAFKHWTLNSGNFRTLRTWSFQRNLL